MKNWIIIESFERLQQANFRKSILEQNGIESIVMSQRDSAFLLGEIDLYVKKNDFATAKEVLKEFNGWTKINSFIRKEPILLQEEILQRSELETLLVEDFDPVLDKIVYNLYVKNKSAELVAEKFSHLLDWELITSNARPRFIAYYFDILNRYEIKSLVIISKNESNFIDNISLYAEKSNSDFAQNLIAELRGWTVIHSPYSKDDAENWCEFLEENKIPALYEYESESKKFYLYSPLEFENEAIDLVKRNRNWNLLETFSDFYQAIMAKNVLSEKDISSIIMTKKDSMFLLGDIELFVEDKNLKIAENILNSALNFERTENEE